MTQTPIVDRAAQLFRELDREWDEVETERQAFHRFKSRIQECEIQPTQHALREFWSGTTEVLHSESQDKRIKSTYRETVMSVNHYENRYDETLVTNMANEFGIEIARIVMNASEITPPLKRAVVDAATTAVDERTTFLSTLEAEREFLRDQYARLETMSSRLSGLERDVVQSGVDRSISVFLDELRDLEEDLKSVVSRRQHHVHTRFPPAQETDDPTRLIDYLYHSLDTRYPLLHDVARLLTRAANIRDHLLYMVLTAA